MQGTPDCVPIYAALTEHARYLFETRPARSADQFLKCSSRPSCWSPEYYGLDSRGAWRCHQHRGGGAQRKVIYRPRRSRWSLTAPLRHPHRDRRHAWRSIRTAPAACRSCSRSIIAGERMGLLAERWFTALFSLLCSRAMSAGADAACAIRRLHHFLATLRERARPP